MYGDGVGEKTRLMKKGAFPNLASGSADFASRRAKTSMHRSSGAAKRSKKKIRCLREHDGASDHQAKKCATIG
jgi:hypothetical protein